MRRVIFLYIMSCFDRRDAPRVVAGEDPHSGGNRKMMSCAVFDAPAKVKAASVRLSAAFTCRNANGFCDTVRIYTLRNAWEEAKNFRNQRDHGGITFKLAALVFEDELSNRRAALARNRRGQE